MKEFAAAYAHFSCTKGRGAWGCSTVLAKLQLAVAGDKKGSALGLGDRWERHGWGSSCIQVGEIVWL